MSKTVEAMYDGEVLRLTHALDLLPNTKVWITVETAEPEPSRSFLTTARAVRLDGPSDWSENLENYLYDHPAQD